MQFDMKQMVFLRRLISCLNVKYTVCILVAGLKENAHLDNYSRLRNVTTGCFVQHAWFIRNVR